MNSLQKDRLLLKHAETNLKDYLLSDQLFWPLDAGERLTLGSLLLAMIRMQSLTHDSDDVGMVERVSLHISEIRSAWRTNWANKAAMEFRSRLRQWELVLRELLSPDEKQTVVYPHEVTLRVILALLQPEILEPDLYALEHLAALDRRLSGVCH
ncbi:MAG: hypothetical protein AAGU05_15415, partial [Anaerolineaceae bacterium]